jgi:hypothetical protein
MKTKVLRRLKQRASALLTALIICSIFSLFVVYYLSLIEQQNFLNNRSQTWNMAMAITEAGIEEGMENLNDNTNALSTAPWSFIGGNIYYRSNTLPDGNSYTVFITNTPPNPTVVARSYVQSIAFTTASQNIASGFFAAAGVNGNLPTIVTRAVAVNCTRSSLYLAAIVAKKNINLNGNNISTDSFASCDPTKSSNGQYNPAIYAGNMGDIASNQGVIDTISGGNANIYGHAHTGPGQNTVSTGPNGGVGTHAWQANNTGIESGYALPDANFTFPDTAMPNTGGYLTPTGGVLVVATYTNVTAIQTTLTVPVPGTYIGPVTTNKLHGQTTYTYNLITGTSTLPTYSTNTYNNILWGVNNATDYANGVTANYVANSLSGQTCIVGDNVQLALPNGLNMSGNDSITIVPYANVNNIGLAPLTTAPPGANVTVYSGGTSFAIGGNGIINQPGLASDFVFCAAPTVTSGSLSGNGAFTGILVAPTVDLTLNGGGNSYTDFIGCMMVNSATLNGHFHVHYDECLQSAKNDPRYLITAWNEVP